jgi:hypothetical protein
MQELIPEIDKEEWPKNLGNRYKIETEEEGS